MGVNMSALLNSLVCLLSLSSCNSSNGQLSSTSSSLSSSKSSSFSSSSSSSSSSLSSSPLSSIASETYSIKPVASEIVISPNNQSIIVAPAAVVPLRTVHNSDIAANTSGTTHNLTTTKDSTSAKAAVAVAIADTVASTVLVIARDNASAYSAYSGLNGYGIPYQVLLVPQAGTTLPVLNSTTSGNFGAIFILSEVSYDYGGTIGFQSALTTSQWSTLFAYQVSFGVRMVRLDVYPSSDTGTTATGACCADGVTGTMSLNDTSAFLSAGLIPNAQVSTLGLYHYEAAVTNYSIATSFAQFQKPTSSGSTAAVINNIGGREQMVFFISFATNWSPTSNYLQHAFIHWATRGLYAGYRRINLNTQVDDMFLYTDIYQPTNTTFRIRTTDLNLIKTWIPKINAKMTTGSNYFMEIGHNGNGNIGMSDSLDQTGELCATAYETADGGIYYDDKPDPPLEYQKPLGTGNNSWPSAPTKYPYSLSCVNKDPLKVWFATAANRDVFAHLSHTFTHENENNATYYDIYNEISWNQAWLSQVSISSAAKFSAKGLIPPAITGLHNGDALRAWSANGITNCVGDNSRPLLLNTVNEFWPLITTVSANGFAGMQINPRWSTSIFYNCDTADCTLSEWIKTSGGSGDIQSLLSYERDTTSRHLLGLHRDPYMFHQANLRGADVPSTVVNGVSQQLSLIQVWMETMVAEMTRLVTWPFITLKHQDFSQAFSDRMARDQCGYTLTYVTDPTAKTITGVQVGCANGNKCASLIPVTVPGSVTSTQGFTTEQIGKDPLTIWVKLTGSVVSFTLSKPIAW